MIPLADAQARVLRDCRRLPTVSLPLADALGLVVDTTVKATDSIPPFDNSAMDGFAVRAADTVGASEGQPVTLAVVATVAAGSAAAVHLEPGQAARIMTGAPVPTGADAIVMVELTQTRGDQVEIGAEARVGDHIRRAGEDVRQGDVVVSPGTVITPGVIGVLATHGRSEVEVVRRPRVGVMSTGDELVEGAQALERGQIRDSNRPTLLALLRELGCEPVDLGLVPDDESSIREAIESGVAECDALVTSGGVSMGDFDYVKAVLAEIGDMDWMQVAIKPAKPLAFGTVAGVPVFGLPGNPVSSMVSFELFAGPGLRQMMGHADWGRQVIKTVAAEGFRRRIDGKTHFVRVRLHVDPGHAEPGRAEAGEPIRPSTVLASSAGGQGSHQLSAMAAADGLAVLPDGEGVAAGSELEVVVLRPWGSPSLGM